MNSDILITLGHSLWLGLVVYIGLVMVLRLIKPEKCGLRYVLALASIFLFIAGTGAILPLQQAWQERQEKISEQIIQQNAQTVESEVSQSLIPSSFESVLTQENVAEMNVAAETSTEIVVNWYVVMLTLWSLGVVVMLLRLFKSLTLVAGIKKSAVEVVDQKVCAIVAELANMLGLSRKIVLAATDQLKSPAVVGTVKPLILFPVAMLSGLSEEQLRIVVAHELAHIRRYDYLVNLFQNVVEAFFFFNPFVWLINHRIRLEREVCCDQSAAKLCGGREVAQALLASAEIHSNLAVAFAHCGKGELKERVERLVSKSNHKGGVRAVFMSILVGMIVCGCTWFTGNVIGEAGGKLLSPEEVRIAKIREVSNKIKYGRDFKDFDFEKERVVSGKVVLEDGEFKKNVPGIVLHCIDGVNSREKQVYAKVDPEKLTFTKKYNGKLCSVSILSPDYHCEKMDVSGRDKLDNLVVKIKKSSPVVLTFVDDSGKTLDVDGRLCITVRANRKGHDFDIVKGEVKVLKHLPFMSYKVFIPGYQSVVLKPTIGEKRVVKLKKAVPVTGVVVDAETGSPIRGAKIKLRGKFAYDVQYVWDDSFKVACDDQGRFKVDFLNEKETICAVAVADGYCGENFKMLSGSEHRISLGKEIVVKGSVMGLKSLDKLRIRLLYRERGMSSCECTLKKDTPGFRLLQSEDGLFFSVVPFWRGMDLEINVDGYEYDYKKLIDRQPSELLVDLTNAKRLYTKDYYPKRKVKIRFIPPVANSAVEGAVYFNMKSDKYSNNLLNAGAGTGRLYSFTNKIKSNCIETILPAEAKLIIRKKQLRGYSFADTIVDIKSGEGEQVIDIPVKSGGLICGRINYEGEVLQFQGVDPTDLKGKRFLKSGVKVVEGKYSFDFPCGKEQVFAVGIGNKFIGSTTSVKCTAENPVQQVDFAVPEGRDLKVKIVDSFGNKVNVGKSLNVYCKPKDSRLARMQHSFSYEIVDDVVVIRDAATTIPAQLQFHLFSITGDYDNCDYLKRKLDLETESEITLNLTYKKIITGTVVDMTTKKPLKDLKVLAKEKSDRFERVYLKNARKGYNPKKKNATIWGKSDSKGVFTITRLDPDGYYNFDQAVDDKGSRYKLLVANKSKKGKVETFTLYAEKL